MAGGATDFYVSKRSKTYFPFTSAPPPPHPTPLCLLDYMGFLILIVCYLHVLCDWSSLHLLNAVSVCSWCQGITHAASTSYLLLPRNRHNLTLAEMLYIAAQCSEFLSADPEVRVRFPRYYIFWEVVGLERGPLSLVGTIEELLGRKSSGCGL
jgi:hypothetical protein